MAVTDIMPPVAAEALDRERADKAAADLAVLGAAVDEAFIARAKIAEMRIREGALIRERDSLQTELDHRTTKLATVIAQHACALGVTCDVCRVRLDVTSSGELDPKRHVLALYTAAMVLQWGIGPATIAAMNALAFQEIPLMPSAERDLCPAHRSSKP